MPVYRKSLGDTVGSLAPGGSPTGGEYYGAGGRWVNVGGCFFGRAEDWPAFQRMYLCADRYTSCTVPCPADTCGGGNLSACAGYQAPPAAPAAPAPNPAANPPSPYTAAPKDTAGTVKTSPKITVETSEGPVELAPEFVPGVSDGSLTPATIRIPNIWDQLDPTKVSQFEYRGTARTLPGWVSDKWRNTLATALAPLTPGSAVPGADAAPVPVDGGGVSLLVLVAIGGAAWMMRDKKTTRRRAA